MSDERWMSDGLGKLLPPEAVSHTALRTSQPRLLICGVQIERAAQAGAHPLQLSGVVGIDELIDRRDVVQHIEQPPDRCGLADLVVGETVAREERLLRVDRQIVQGDAQVPVRPDDRDRRLPVDQPEDVTLGAHHDVLESQIAMVEDGWTFPRLDLGERLPQRLLLPALDHAETHQPVEAVVRPELVPQVLRPGAIRCGSLLRSAFIPREARAEAYGPDPVYRSGDAAQL